MHLPRAVGCLSTGGTSEPHGLPRTGRRGGAHMACVRGGAHLGALERLLRAPRQRVPGELSVVSVAAGNAHFVGSWIPLDWYPVSEAEG